MPNELFSVNENQRFPRPSEGQEPSPANSAAIFELLCEQSGFQPVHLPTMTPVERFRSVLSNQNLLPDGPRFVDPTGLNWALRCDMTLFLTQCICQNQTDLQFPLKIFYAGKTFSYGEPKSHHYKSHSTNDPNWEKFEFGVESVGDGSWHSNMEMIALAIKLVKGFGFNHARLAFGDSRILTRLLQIVANHPTQLRTHMTLDLRKSFELRDLRLLGRLFVEDPQLEIVFWDSYRDAVSNFERVVRAHLPEASSGDLPTAPQTFTWSWNFDPFLVRKKDYYSGFTFEIYGSFPQGQRVPFHLGGGGRYDTLYSHFGVDREAVGFMLKDPSEGLSHLQKPTPFRIALPKGRIMGLALDLFQKVGIVPATNLSTTRKLVIPSQCGRFEFLIVKNADVGSYLEKEMTAMAIVGSDTLNESQSAVFRPVTFSKGSCRICLAGKPQGQATLKSKRKPVIATKYVQSAKELLDKSQLVSAHYELLPLQGSVELASVVEIADAILDLVETGNTLRENDLEIYENLGVTCIHLALTPGFYYLLGNTLNEWIQVWHQQGDLMDHMPQSIPLHASATLL